MVSKAKVGRLRTRRNFDELKNKGKRVHATNWLLINFSPNVNGELNVGWTLPGYVGSAVVRNRLKRWVRNYMTQANSHLINLSYDINFIFKRQPTQFYKALSHEELDAALSAGFKKLSR